MKLVNDKTDTIKKKLLKALEESLGIVSFACKKCNISRNTYYEWRKKDKQFANDCDDIIYTQSDFIETALLKQIEKGDTTAIIFYCKTKLRDRGYSEKPVRNKIELPPLNTIEDLNVANNILIQKLANAEATEDDVMPLQKIIMQRRTILEHEDIDRRMRALEERLKKAS